MPTDLAGKTAIVTGAGRGIGRAVALALAEAGADVALAARTEWQLEQVAGEISDRGRRGLPVRTDVTVAADADHLVEATLAEFGRLDILVNNSGIGTARPMLETDESAWDSVMATNLRGAFLCTRAAGRHLTAVGAGKVINVASVFALIGRPNFVAYSASKAGLVGFTRALAVEWARHGVQVNAIAPGLIPTDLNAEALRDPDRVRSLQNQIPAGRFGRPEEIGPLAVYLASPASDYVTGAVFPIDGGWHVR